MSDVYLSSVWILDVERTAAPRLSPPENPSTRTSPVSVLMFDAGCPSSVLGVNRQIVLWIVQRWPGNKSAIAAGPDRLIAWLHCSTLSLGSAHMSPTVESWNVAVVHFKCGESTLSTVHCPPGLHWSYACPSVPHLWLWLGCNCNHSTVKTNNY